MTWQCSDFLTAIWWPIHDHIPSLDDAVVGILIAVDDENDVVCSVILVVVVVLAVEDICCTVGTPVSSTFIQSVAKNYNLKLRVYACTNLTYVICNFGKLVLKV